MYTYDYSAPNVIYLGALIIGRRSRGGRYEKEDHDFGGKGRVDDTQ